MDLTATNKQATELRKHDLESLRMQNIILILVFMLVLLPCHQFGLTSVSNYLGFTCGHFINVLHSGSPGSAGNYPSCLRVKAR